MVPVSVISVTNISCSWDRLKMYITLDQIEGRNSDFLRETAF